MVQKVSLPYPMAFKQSLLHSLPELLHQFLKSTSYHQVQITGPPVMLKSSSENSHSMSKKPGYVFSTFFYKAMLSLSTCATPTVSLAEQLHIISTGVKLVLVGRHHACMTGLVLSIPLH